MCRAKDGSMAVNCSRALCSDVSYLLVRGTREEIEDAVKKAIKDAATGGGYILSSCHSHPYVDGTRLKWMVEAAHKYGKYPIRI